MVCLLRNMLKRSCELMVRKKLKKCELKILLRSAEILFKILMMNEDGLWIFCEDG